MSRIENFTDELLRTGELRKSIDLRNRFNRLLAEVGSEFQRCCLVLEG